MRKYAAYIKILDALLEATDWGRRTVQNEALRPHLNGGADMHLRNLVDRRQLRESGAFFTGESLGRRLVAMLPATDWRDTPAWDPNCGAGDLLLRWSEGLPLIDNDLPSTLKYWGEMLRGVEIHSVFLRAAKRRLALAAVCRGARVKSGRLRHLDGYFPNLECRNLLEREISVPDSSVILMNPPFTMIDTPRESADWASGNVAFAAVAFLNCLKAAAPGQQILAILPDVLRSGSRYGRWRKLVAQHAIEAKVHLIGRFSGGVDVDVVILHATAGQDGESDVRWFPSMLESGSTLGDFCDVHVGSVVPYRHRHKGEWVPYLTVAHAPAWADVHSSLPCIRHNGTCVTGPFLAVRRTSSPADKTRAIATVVASTKPTAIENHLLTVRPRDGKLETCRQMLEVLRSEFVQQWLDQRIRCRHITVDVLRGVPISMSRIS